ncbi:hypothetical protein ACOMHN_015275 [Nucella lapillus]
MLDPSLYINRFANKLEFGDRTNEVCSTALRLVQRMTRDWMHTGRRPNGLCGAALLVSARMHDFSRAVKEIIKVVKVCETTIRKRLYEFEDTPSSQLTIEEFHNIDLEEEQDPPCFTEGKKRSKMHQSKQDDTELTSHLAEVQSLQQEIEKSLVRKPTGIWAAYSKMEGESDKPSTSEMAAMADFIEEETLREVIEPPTGRGEGSPAAPAVQSDSQAGAGKGPRTDPGKSFGEEERRRQHEEEQERMRQGLPVHRLAPTAASLGIRDMVEDLVTLSEEEGQGGGEGEEVGGELDLEGINDEELDKLLLSEPEVKIKTEIWMKENEDFLIAQKEREERRLKEEQEHGVRPEKKKRKYKKRDKNVEAASAKEAFAMVIQDKKLSRKINYEVLEDLRVKDKQTPSTTPAGSTSQIGPGSGTSVPGSSHSILKPDSSLNRSKRPSLLEDSEEEATPAKRKSVQIREPAPWRENQPMLEVAASPQIVEETGPVPYLEHEPEIATEEEEEEEEEDEDRIHTQHLYAGEASLEYEEEYYVDCD